MIVLWATGTVSMTSANQPTPGCFTHAGSQTCGFEPVSEVVEGALWASKLSFHCFARGATHQRMRAAYECWHDVWYSALVELDHIERLNSDDFTRQDEIAALFYEDTCIGLTGCRFVELTTAMARHDSYFNAWPEQALEMLGSHGTRICIGNNMTVRSQWRGRIGGLSVKRLLMILSIQRFLVSSADALAGTMRNDRGMNRLVYELGFSPITQGAIAHGVDVDLVAYFRRSELRQLSARTALSSEFRLAFDLMSRCEFPTGFQRIL